MTQLSVNVNKIALLRNSRGTDFPNLRQHAERLLTLGVNGITVHPRSDERHIRRSDIPVLAALLREHPQAEYNIEGYPSEDFLRVVLDACPDQCTLVPDSATQLTSDHGWDPREHFALLNDVLTRLKGAGIRTAVFMDPDVEQIGALDKLQVDRIELYTEPYARAWGGGEQARVLEQFRIAGAFARDRGIELNAGHDLNLQNLSQFLTIPAIEEVSIGHALTVESMDFGLAPTIARYLDICAASAS